MNAADGVDAALRTLGRESQPPWWLAVSGGCDSMVLLHAAARRARELGIAARVLHVDHGLHADAPRWAESVRRAALAAGLPVWVRRVSVAAGNGLEQRARGARYGCFRAALAKGGTLLLAHHADDQIENILLGVLRGRRAAELTMPASRPLAGGTLRRPLLTVTRIEIEAYARRHGLEWHSDPANAELRHDRNHVRHVLLPEMRTRYQLEQRLPAFARRLAEDSALAAELARVDLQSVAAPLDPVLGVAELAPPLSVSALAGLSPRRSSGVLRIWLEPVTGHVSERLLAELGRRLGRGARLDMAVGNARLRQFRDRLHLLPRQHPVTPQRRAVRLGGDHGGVDWAGGRLHWRPAGTGLDASRLQDVRALRPRHAGERIEIAGRGRLPVARLLAEAGVPWWWRDHVPVLADAQDVAVAVAGCAVASSWQAPAAVAAVALTWQPAASDRWSAGPVEPL